MKLPPSHPIRLTGLLMAGALLPLAVLALALLLSATGLAAAIANEDNDGCLIPAILLLLAAVPPAIWMFRSSPGPRLAPLNPDEAPELVGLMERVTQGVKGVRAGKLWLMRGYHVSLQARPVLGPLGWASHGWLVGIFTLMHYTPREFEASLLWDQAYWSRQHGWLNLETKRLLQFWRDLQRNLESQATNATGWKALLRPLRKLMLGTAKRILSAGEGFLFDQVLMADRSVGLALGAQTTAQMLLKEGLTPFMVDTLWYKVWLEAQTPEGLPGATPFHDAQAFLKRWPTEAVAHRLEALLEGHVGGPTALRYRLDTLGVNPAPPMPPQRSAFEAFLLDAAPEVVDRMEATWRSEMGENLLLRDRRRQESLRRFEAFKAREAVGGLKSGEWLEWARLAAEHATPGEARACLDRLVAELPKSGDAWVLRTRFLLGQGDLEAGLPALDRVRALHPLNASVAAEIWADHLEKLNPEGEEVRSARLEAYRAARELELAKAERQSVGLADALDPHGTTEENLEILRAWIRGLGDVDRAYLVRKRVKHLPESPLFLLLLVPKRPFWLLELEVDRRQRQAALVRTLPALPDAKLFLLLVSAGLRRRATRFQSLPGCEIYRSS